ncbi:hypothetical protein [Kitasatospora kifunensis]|uniref:Uncharacterized protein n=1 Tax=Kitasatospora kifunensis TaxID=58351 RepID=A0A7W7R8T6_KITKI|nr:hypothetical protein [Kitasatospora kifunensis]MBB4927380.1 hypothetical protein [Kitasatospora kifunensis]
MTALEPTAETNLLKPARGTVPSPLRVSTMDELEYGTVVLRFGRDLPSGTSKVYCRGITVKVPTGRSGADLTVEPSLITTAVSKVEGEAQGWEWNVDRDTTDPNEAVFSFVPDTTAVFDGTWAVSFTLSGIEVNPSIGTVDLDIEETTSTTGEEGSYERRTGKVQVKKGNDEFFFRSLHPRTTVIERGVTVDLLWDAPADNRIVYTMYYRGADGKEATDSNQANFANQVWKSPALNDNANFTLKATLDGQDYFLTTYLTVNNPNIVVNTLRAGGDATFDGDVTATASGKSVRIRQLRGNGVVPLQISNSTELDSGCNLTVGGTLTSTGLATANGGLTVKSDKALSAGAVTASGLITANNGLTVKSDQTLTAGVITASGLITANNGLTVKSDKTLSAGEVTIANGKFLSVTKIKSTVGSPIELQNSISQTAGSLTTAGGVTATGAIKSDGKAVILAGDSVSLESLYFTGKFLNGSGKQSHSDNSNVSGPAAFYRAYDGASKFKIAHR